MRCVLVTGGGGAGVSTLAAATAVLCAERGTITRLAGVEPLALVRILGGDAPASLQLNGAGSSAVFGDDAGAVAAWLRHLLGWLGADDIFVDELEHLPGVRVASVVLSAADEAAEVTIVDLGPTQEALPVLQLLLREPLRPAPDLGESAIARLVRPLLIRAVDLPQPDADVQRAGGRAAARLQRLRALLRDPASVSLRVLLSSDGRAVTVRREAETFAGLWGIALDTFVHRTDGAVTAEDARQSGLGMPWTASPPIGGAALENLAATVYGSHRPDAALSPAMPPHFVLHATGADLVLSIPSRPFAEFRATRVGDEMLVSAGAWRRKFTLPAQIIPQHASRAWHDGVAFRVRFEQAS